MSSIDISELLKQKERLDKELSLLEEVTEEDVEFESLAEEVMYEECENSLEAFVINGWDFIAKGNFIDSWHVSCICDHLEALFRLEIKKLIVSVAPRHAKSALCSVAFPIWCWLQDPSFQVISASYSQPLSELLAGKSRDLIYSPWFQKAWKHRIKFQKEQQRFYQTVQQGHRFATSIEGSVTGYPGDLALIDDPHKAKDYLSKAKREAVKAFYDSSISNRWNHPSTFRQMIIHQRIAEDDLTGYLLESQPGEWEHIKLPVEYIPTVYVSKIGWSDPRTREGELLNPLILGEDDVATEKKKGEFHWFPQYQQEPVSTEGGYVKKSQIQYYGILPDVYDLVLTSWDLTFGESDIDKRGSAWNVGQVWLKNRANRFLVHQVRFQGDINKQLREIINVANTFPEARTHLIENKANGTAVIDLLKREIPGLIPIEPKEYGGDKEARLLSCLPEFQSGNVWFPEIGVTGKRWVKDVEGELFVFPRSRTKDCVDTLSQALNYMAVHCRTQLALLPNTIQENTFSYFNDVTENKFHTINVSPTTEIIRGLFT